MPCFSFVLKSFAYCKNAVISCIAEACEDKQVVYFLRDELLVVCNNFTLFLLSTSMAELKVGMHKRLRVSGC